MGEMVLRSFLAFDRLDLHIVSSVHSIICTIINRTSALLSAAEIGLWC